MRRLQIPPAFILAQYIMALVMISVMTGALFLVQANLSSATIALLYLLPVGLATALWGLGPAIAAALAAFLAFNYFFLSPTYTFAVHQPQDLLVLLVFLIVAVAISQLVGRAKLGLASATERERESTRLYELSTLMAASHNTRSIAHALAGQIVETFQADCVEVGVEARAGNQPMSLRLPPEAVPLRDRPIIIPLMTARGLQGEIRLWRSEAALTPMEDRLLHTFASQGALALERAALARSENRAQVLEESDRLKSALLSSVSHELRTPLAAIKAAVSSLRSGAVEMDSEAGREMIATIEEETDQLNQLVGNLLDMSRIEAGALQPRRKWNALVEIIGDTVAHLKPLSKHHRIVVSLAEDLPLVPVDFVQLQQVFTNLISNSLKYSPENTVIRIEAVRRDAQTVQVKVINHSPLVPEEHLTRIFDKFYRITEADRVMGTGLGLSICKGIIEAHGGWIWAENLPDGFAFNFTLPTTAKDMPPLKTVERETD